MWLICLDSIARTSVPQFPLFHPIWTQFEFFYSFPILISKPRFAYLPHPSNLLINTSDPVLFTLSTKLRHCGVAVMPKSRSILPTPSPQLQLPLLSFAAIFPVALIKQQVMERDKLQKRIFKYHRCLIGQDVWWDACLYIKVAKNSRGHLFFSWNAGWG